MRTRDKPVLIYLSSDEFARLEEKASSASLSKSAFIRDCINGVVLKEAPPVDYYEMIIQLRRVGSNINQLLKLANAKGIIISDELRKALAENRKIEKALWKAVTPEKQ